MAARFHSEEIRTLCDQLVRFAPREKRAEQADRAELFLREVVPGRSYSTDMVCFRVTGYRPDSRAVVTVSGSELIEDLLTLIEELSDAADIPASSAGQPVMTVDELARRFNVSTKTISRWRQQGLVSRRFVFENGRKRVGFLASSIEYFQSHNGEKIRRGEKFSQLTDADRATIIQRARRLAAAGGCPSEVARRIARKLDRSVETIRYTIRQFDEKFPDLAVFPDQAGPLNLEIKERIYADFMSGKTAESIAQRYCRTRNTVYRVVNEMRARAVMELPLEYMDNPEFHRKGADRRILEMPFPDSETAQRRTRAPSGLPRYLASLYETPLLSREQEQYLFRRYNYLKFKAARLRQQIDPAAARPSDMDAVEKLFSEAVAVKNRIVQSNLRLVVSIAKRHINGNGDDFFQLVSDGNLSLIRAVEKFDYARGNKFSTYASWAIMKNYARTIPDEFRVRERFRPTSEEVFLGTADARPDSFLAESEQEQRVRQVSRILAALDEREQQIIISRFGLDYRQEPQTLKQVGEEMGVTKERVRQIEARALVKLREAAIHEKIELPDNFEQEN